MNIDETICYITGNLFEIDDVRPSHPSHSITIHTNPDKPQVKGSSKFNNLGLDQGNITQLIQHLNEVCYLFPSFLFIYIWENSKKKKKRKKTLIMLSLKSLDLDIPLDKAKDFNTGECLISLCFSLLYGMGMADGVHWKLGIWRIISRRSMRKKTMRGGPVIRRLDYLGSTE